MTTITFKLTQVEIKAAHNAFIYLSNKELPNPIWKYVALNVIELDDAVLKINKFTIKCAEELGYYKDGKYTFTNQDERNALTKAVGEIYEKDKKTTSFKLYVLECDLIKDISLPPDMMKALLKLKIAK